MNHITNTQISGLMRMALVAVEEGNMKLVDMILARFREWNKRSWSDGTLDLDLSWLAGCHETVLQAIEPSLEDKVSAQEELIKALKASLDESQTALNSRTTQLNSAFGFIDELSNRVDVALTEKQIAESRVLHMENLVIGINNELTNVINENESELLSK